MKDIDAKNLTPNSKYDVTTIPHIPRKQRVIGGRTVSG
jgi:hypothetical protein